MKTVETKTSRQSHRRPAITAKADKHAAADSELAQAPEQQTGFVQRKCACGGSCSNCQKEQPLQTKLRVSEPGDYHELEADRVADQVMRAPATPVNAAQPALAKPATATVQRQAQADNAEEAQQEEEEEAAIAQAKQFDHATMQSKTTASEHTGAAQIPIEGLQGSTGRPLPDSTRAFFEPRMGASFAAVRIHNDASADQAARQMHAKAFTVGNHIYYAQPYYQSDSAEGRRLLAHELAHTLQQGAAKPLPGYEALPVTPLNMPARVQRLAEMPASIDSDAFDLNPAGGNPGAVSEHEILAPNEYDLSGDISVDDANLAGGAPQGHDAGISADGEADEGFQCPDILTPIVDFAAEDSGLIPAGATFPVAALMFVPPPFNLLVAGATEAAAFVWNNLPLEAKAATVNAMIDFGIEALAQDPHHVAGNKYAKIALRAFLRRLRREPDQRKVFIAEKMGNLILGRDVQFFWGYLKGLVVGFFVDGLLGIIQMIIDLVCLIPMMFNFIDRILRFIEMFPQAIRDAIQSLIELRRSIEQALEHALETIMEIYHHPERILEFLQTIDERMTEMANSTGERAAELMLTAFGQPFDRIGFAVGRVFGMIVFEIVLAIVMAVLTFYIGGSGAAASATASAGKTALRVFMTALRKSIKFIARMIRPITRYVSGFLDKAKDFVLGLRPVLTRAWGRVSEKLARVFDKIKDLFHRFMLLLDNNRFFLQFIAVMRAKMLNPRYSVRGIGNEALYVIVVTERSKPRFVRVVSLPRISAADNRGNWLIRVGRVGIPLAKVSIAEARMDSESRKDYAGEFIQERVDDMHDNDVSDEKIEDEIGPFKNAYHLDTLHSEYDAREHDFNIMASASAEEEIASRDSPWPTGTQTDPVPMRWFRRPDVYPVIKVYEVDENGDRHLVRQGSPLTGGVTLPEYRSLNPRPLWVSPTNMRPITAMQKGERGGESNKEEVGRRLRNDPNIEVVEDDGTVLTGSQGSSRSYAIDHVRELTLGGDDEYGNLWPVRATINSAFNANFNQAIWLQYGDDIDKTRVKNINGKWVEIDDVANEVPRTSGGHGTLKDRLPINRGRLTGGVRKRFPRRGG